MICKNCGTEIADKALVCFRCGTATFEAKIRPAAPQRSRSQVPVVLAFIVLVLAALFMSQAAAGETPRLLSWVLLGLAVVVLAWRLFQRRR